MADRLSAEQVAARSERNRAAWRDAAHDLLHGPKTRQKAAEVRQMKPDTEKRRKRATGALKALPGPSEHAIQVALIKWWTICAPARGVDPRLLVAVPNAGAGGSRGQAGKMKAEGARPGYPDLLLDLPVMSGERVVFHGARFELKAKKGRISPEQRSYHDLLIKQNYMVLVCWGFDDAVRAITAYVDRALSL